MDRQGRITVAHVVLSLEIGGLEQMVVNLISHTDTERFTNVLLCVTVGGPLLDEIRPRCQRVEVFGKQEGLAYRLPVRMAKLLREERVDVVHCHNYGPLVYGALAARIVRSTPIVFTAHGPNASRRSRLRFFRRMGLVDKVVAVSDDSRNLVLETAGFRGEDVITIPNGIDVDVDVPNAIRLETARELGITPGTTVIGTVARLAPEKDHDTLFAAIAGNTLDFPHRLVVVGDGPRRSELENLARRLGINDRVVFLGNRRDIPELLSVFDVFVLSSHFEGMSMTILEAMAAGLPVVASDVGGNRQIIADGDTGIVVPPANPDRLAEAIKRLCLDDVERERMGARGRRRATRNFSVATMTKRYEEVYDNLVKTEAAAS